MSNYLPHVLSVSDGGDGIGNGISITIPEAATEDGVTFYRVRVDVDRVNWTVKRRYRDFDELHDALVEAAAGVAKDSLPAKKAIGNKDPAFVMRRRRDLEAYLQSVFRFLQRAIPKPLAEFLDLNRYDINFLLNEMAARYHDGGQEAREASWTPLEMFAISSRLRSPLPPPPPTASDPNDASDSGRRTDFTNVADQACQMTALRLTGSSDALGTSNAVPNELSFDFLAFKSLAVLVLSNVRISPPATSISALGAARRTLRRVQANNCGLKSVAAFLLCDVDHDADDEDGLLKIVTDSSSSLEWPTLEHLDLRYNRIGRLDASLRLAPSIQNLHLGSNRVSAVENLSQLTRLNTLELADNELSEMPDLNVRLGQVGRIDVSHNKLRCLSGFRKLYSLRHLNAAANRIKDLESVCPHVSNLPCLESLNLQGNQVTATVVDYRLKVFKSFGRRCAEICLDNELPSQSEVDKVSVLMALSVAKEGRPPTSLFGNLPGRVS